MKNPRNQNKECISWAYNKLRWLIVEMAKIVWLVMNSVLLGKVHAAYSKADSRRLPQKNGHKPIQHGRWAYISTLSKRNYPNISGYGDIRSFSLYWRTHSTPSHADLRSLTDADFYRSSTRTRFSAAACSSLGGFDRSNKINFWFYFLLPLVSKAHKSYSGGGVVVAIIYSGLRKTFNSVEVFFFSYLYNSIVELYL